ncbi:CBS domain-containing protein [Paenibacillus methanolicus]|uniref:CBS domain-containing protein n=1 Tax=Paenibacillus methanolicus TaxID=582686 RepID=A0A5S5CDN0_9BACL|nr:CBS domain-containing protein [Paenibacillus methanolicus]TYP76426.1 CBS domain-containing protein [Paenibacillus methanolicus]
MANKIREIMTTDVKTVGLKEDIRTVAALMRDSDVGVIPVVEGDRCVGLVTDRDIVIRGIAENKQSFTVEDVYSKRIIGVKPETSIKEAAKLMADEQIRRLPVMDDDKLVGIVSMADLALDKNSKDEAELAVSGVSQPSSR